MENEKTVEVDSGAKKSIGNSIVVGAIGIVSLIYLFNPTGGFIELIPDNIPVIGNLDEAAAAGLLISCLAYFGIDFGGLFGRKEKKKDEEADFIDIEVDEK
ncbi:MAG: hypothetical protein CMO55_18775 [Verrucomicrobiales bacterium]|nr:hypothetical protein [Verrucomicrobiales bacterium]